jgi:hypothetical protein
MTQSGSDRTLFTETRVDGVPIWVKFYRLTTSLLSLDLLASRPFVAVCYRVSTDMGSTSIRLYQTELHSGLSSTVWSDNDIVTSGHKPLLAYIELTP